MLHADRQGPGGERSPEQDAWGPEPALWSRRWDLCTAALVLLRAPGGTRLVQVLRELCGRVSDERWRSPLTDFWKPGSGHVSNGQESPGALSVAEEGAAGRGSNGGGRDSLVFPEEKPDCPPLQAESFPRCPGHEQSRGED